MGRPVDWNDVFGFDDPTPGDVYDISAIARRWGGIADAAEMAESKLRGWLRDDSVASWIGKAGDAFAEHSSELPDQLGKAKDSYRQASEAMSWWSGRLDVHQGDADAALVKGRTAKSDLASAQNALQAASGGVSTAAGAGALTYDGASDAANAPTSDAVRDATNKLHAAQAAQTHAQGLVSDAQGRLDAARKLASDAGDLRRSDGRTTAGKVHDAADAGIKPRSRWQKFKDGVAEAWKVIVEIAKVVVLVLGVVALIIGGPLAWIVFAAALIVLADTIMKYIKGQATLLDVALAALACIPGTKGLTTLSELSAAFKAGGAIGATMHVLSAGKTAIVEMAQGIKALSGGLRSTLASLGGRFPEGVLGKALGGAEGRVYSMWDDVAHTTSFAPEQLGAGAKDTLGDVLSANGWSMDDLTKAINTPTSDLSAVERSTLNTVRDSISAEGHTMQKVVDPAMFDRYLNAFDDVSRNAGNFDPASVRGFITRADDTAHLANPSQVFDGLRLDYAGTRFDAAAADVHVIRFDPVTDAVTIPRHPDMGGVRTDDPPFTGNGFTGSHDVVPEFHTDGVRMSNGAEMWQLSDNGTQRLVAVLRKGQWIPGGLW